MDEQPSDKFPAWSSRSGGWTSTLAPLLDLPQRAGQREAHEHPQSEFDLFQAASSREDVQARLDDGTLEPTDEV